MKIETRFGKRCVFNGKRLKGILLEGETLDEFLVRTTHVREKLPIVKVIKHEAMEKRPVGRPSKNGIRHETKCRQHLLYGIMDKTLIGTLIII